MNRLGLCVHCSDTVVTVQARAECSQQMGHRIVKSEQKVKQLVPPPPQLTGLKGLKKSNENLKSLNFMSLALV